MFIIKATNKEKSSYLSISHLGTIFWEAYLINATIFKTKEECISLICSDDLSTPFIDSDNIIRPPISLYLFNGCGEDIKLELIKVTHDVIHSIVTTFKTEYPTINTEN